jgi:hypothetical protein
MNERKSDGFVCCSFVPCFLCSFVLPEGDVNVLIATDSVAL